jgi:hypothetical protein
MGLAVVAAMVAKVGLHVTMIIVLMVVFHMVMQSYLVNLVVEVDRKTLLVLLQVVAL